MTASPETALLVVDVQKDFCPGGALAVKGGDAVVPRLNRVIRVFADKSLPVILSRDWHPRNHVSFSTRGGPWPAHCVRGTSGAEFHDALLVPPGSTVVSKATDPDRDAYSAFEGTGLAEELRSLGVRELVVGGLATDYCVKNSVLDALGAGFAVVVLTDCVKGVNLHASDSAKAVRSMKKAGASTANSEVIIDRIGRRVAVVSSLRPPS